MTSEETSLATQRAERSLTAHWVIFAVTCSVVGWLLSALHLLNEVGFLVSIPLIHFIIAKLCGVQFPSFRKPVIRWQRWKRILPAGFLLIAVLAILGGILHAPNNMDALHFRMPRVAHWLMAERWEWFPANNNAQNTRSCGFEWMSAPIISLSGTDRYITVINSLTFLLLPGVCFGVLRGMGVSRKVSWAWMWLVSVGYCFALQAGGVGNDLTPSFFAAAAFAFGFRWKTTQAYSSFALAMVAVGAMTACKPSTLPLLLPFAVIFFGMWKPALAHPLRTLILAVFVVFGSFLPTAALNIRQCGDWTGLQAENAAYGKVEPLIGVAGNLINAPLQNLAPPIFPLAGKWNSFFLSLFPEKFIAAMKRNFEPTGAEFILPDIQGEEWAGIGFGITHLLIITAIITFYKGRAPEKPGIKPRLWLYSVLFITALLVYFAKTGLFTVARHISPYYVFLCALALLSLRPDHAMRTILWKCASGAAMASTLIMVIITPSRPLWPANWFFKQFGDEPSSRIIQRAALGFSIYKDRSSALGPMRNALPADAREVGFISFGAGSEMPFWKPYGTMRVHHIRPGDSVNDLRQKGMRHIVLNSANFALMMGREPEEWTSEHGGKILLRFPIQITAQGAVSDWLLVELP